MDEKINDIQKKTLLDILSKELSFKKDRINIILYSSLTVFGLSQFFIRFFHKVVAYLFLAIAFFGILKLKEIFNAHKLVKLQIKDLQEDLYTLHKATFLGFETELIENGFQIDNEKILFANDLNTENAFKKTALFSCEDTIIYCNLDLSHCDKLLSNHDYLFIEISHSEDYIFIDPSI